jgi:hypothetical protein
MPQLAASATRVVARPGARERVSVSSFGFARN